MGDFGGREHLFAFPIRLDPDAFNKPDAVIVTASAAGDQGTNEVQQVTITGIPTGGTFTLTYSGQTTAAIAWNADAAAVQAALEALSNLAPGDVHVGGANPAFVVEFGGSLEGTDVAALTATPSLTGGTAPSVTIVTAIAGDVGDTSLAVNALSGPIPNGKILDFGNGVLVKLAAGAITGATSLTTAALTKQVPAAATATYAGADTTLKSIPSGTPIGRSEAERTSKSPFGPAVDTDFEIYLLADEVSDVNSNADGVAYRHTSLVKENYLPGWTSMASGLKTKIRELYQCIVGVK
jgi:hypothetical protein